MSAESRLICSLSVVAISASGILLSFFFLPWQTMTLVLVGIGIGVLLSIALAFMAIAQDELNGFAVMRSGENSAGRPSAKQLRPNLSRASEQSAT